MRAQESVNTGSDFARSLLQQESRLREHLDFAGQTNRSLKEGIEAARRKLNNSASTGLIRPQQDPRNLVAVQGRPSRDHFSNTQTPQHNTHSLLVRRGAPEVPEENDEEVGQLRKEVAVLRRENDGLRQVVAQNDASARFAIGQLQGALDAARADAERTRGESERAKGESERMRGQNERIRLALQNAIKQNNDTKVQLQPQQQGKLDTSSCLKCPRLQSKIRQLQLQLSELTLKLSESSRQLQLQSSRRNELTLSSESFRDEMNLRLKNMEGWLKSRNEEIMVLQQKNLDLSRKMTERERQLNQEITTLTDEYYALSQAKQRAELQSRRANAELEGLQRQLRESEKQSRETTGKLLFLSSKIDALNGQLWQGEREKSDVVVAVGELEEKIAETRYRLEQREAEGKELQSRLLERDSHLKRLGEEYSSSLERAEQLEELSSQLRQRNEDLQSEVDRLRSTQYPSSFNPNQLMRRLNSLQEELEAEQESVKHLQERLAERENTLVYLQGSLEQATESYENLARQKQIQSLQLTETIQALTEQNHTIVHQYSELQLTSTHRQEQAAAEREELIRRLQRSESALELLNKHPLQTGEERRIAELQDLVVSLRQEVGHYESEQKKMKQEVERVQYEIKQTKHERELGQQGFVHLQEELTRTYKERDEFGQEVGRLSQILQEREHSNTGDMLVESLKNQLIILERETAAIRQENIALIQENSSLKNDIALLGHQKDIILIEKKTVEEENRILKKESSKKTEVVLSDNSKALPSQDATLKREISALEQENTHLKQRFSTFQQQIASLQVQNVHLLQQSRTLIDQNTTLQKQVKDLAFENQLQYSNLEKAENYIATLIEQITTQSIPAPAPTRTRDDPTFNQNKILAHERQSLLQQNQTLRIKIDQLTKQQRNQPTQSPIKEQRDPTSTIELANLQVKNQELQAHLSSAERFINSLEQRVQELVEIEQHAHRALMHERQTKAEVERMLLSKDAIIEKQNREYRQEVANRDALIDSLQRRIADVGRIQPIEPSSTSQREVQEAYQRIALLEDEVATLQRERLQLVDDKAASDAFAAKLDREAARVAEEVLQLKREKEKEKREKAEEHEHLVRAEAYITELLEQIQKIQTRRDAIPSKNQGLRPTAPIISDNRDLANENQILIQDNNRLSTENEQFYKRTQALRKEIQIAHAQIQTLREQKQLSPKKFDRSPQKESPQKEVPQSVQLEGLRLKNEQLFNHLQRAEAYIITLQEEVQNLTKAQQQSLSIINKEKTVRLGLEEALSVNEGQKDKTINELRRELQKTNQSIKALTLASQEGKSSNDDERSDKRQIVELQTIVSTLRSENSQQEVIIRNTSIERQQLVQQLNTLQSQINHYNQHPSPPVGKDQETDPAFKQALRAVKYENQILAKQNRQLTIRLQEKHAGLEAAENYISQLLNNLPENQQKKESSLSQVAAENVRLINELQKTLNEKKKLEVSLENQVRLKKELQLQVQQLNNFLLRAQNEFELNARQASEELRILKEMCGANPSPKQPEQPPAKVESKQQLKVPSPEGVELTAIKAKNEELYEHLKSAEDYIAQQEKTMQELINNELSLKKALSVQGEARSRLQSQTALKDAEMHRIRLGLEQQIQEKDRTIDELRANLQKSTEAQRTYATQLQAIEDLSIKDTRIAQLEHIISNLRNKTIQQDAAIAAIQQQANILIAQKSSNRQVQEKIRQRLQRENEALKKKVDMIQLQKQTQIKNEENAQDYIASLLEQINRGTQVQQINSQRLNMLENQCKELQKQKDALFGKNQSMNAENRQLSIVNQTLSNQKSVLTAKILSLQAQYNSLLQQVRDEQSDLIAKSQTQQGQIKALQQQIREEQLKLQSQTDQTNQARRDANDLANQLAHIQRDSQKNIQQFMALQQSHQQLAKELQKQLQEQPKQQQPNTSIQTTFPSDELQSLRNQNRDLHIHLQTAQEFIMNLQKHLEGLGRAQEQLRSALAQEQQAKSQIESAITAKEQQVQRLNQEVLRSKTQLDPLKQKVNQLQSESLAANQRIKLTESKLEETVRQLDELRAKLGEAEDYIINLQGEISRLREFLARAEASIAALSDQNNRIKQQQATLPKQSQGEDLRKVIDALQLEVRQVNAQKQANAEQSRQRQSQLEALLQELGRQLQSIKGKPVESKVKPEEDAEFFKNKLIEAEDYIAQIERLQETNQKILAQQSVQLNDQAQKISNLQTYLSNSNKKNTDLTGQLLRAQQIAKKLQNSLRNQPTADDLSKLSYQINDLQGKLAACQQERLNLAKSNDEVVQKLRKSQEKAAVLEIQKTKAQSLIPVLQSRLQQAEEQASTLAVKGPAVSQAMTDHQASIQDLTRPLFEENQVLKKKLREAEQYIFQDQKELADQQSRIRELQEKKKELVDDNVQLKQKLQKMGIQPQEETSPIENAQFFKDKLFQAESYIHQMNQDYAKTVAEVEAKQGQINALKAKIEELLLSAPAVIPEMDKSNELIQAVNDAKADAESLRKKLKQAETYIHQMDQKYPKVVADAKAKQNQIDSLKEQGKILENKNERLSNQVQRLNKQLQDKHEDTKRALDEAERIYKTINDDNQRKNAQLKDAQAKIQQLQASSADLLTTTLPNQQLPDLKNVQADAEKLKAKLIQAETYIQNEIPRLANDLQYTKARLQQAQRRQKAANDENTKTNQKLVQVEKERDIANERADYTEGLLMDTVKHLEELKGQPLADPVKEQAMNDHIQAVQNEIEALQAANNDLKQHLDHSDKENKQLQERLRQAQTLAKTADDQVAKLLQKLTEAEGYIYQLEGENQRIKQAPMTNVDEIGRLKAKLTEVQGLIDDGEQENKTLKEKLSQAEDFIRHQDDELKLLREKMQAEDEEGGKLKAELAKKKQENTTLKEQLGEAESHIINQDEEMQRLLGKLAQAQAHIEDQENRLRAKLTQAEQEIDTLEEESSRLKARLASPSPQPLPKLDDTRQQIAVLQEEIRRLKVEKDINEERLQAKQQQIRTLSQALESLNNQPVAVPPLKPQELQEDASFFRNKLLQAQRYIQQMEHINQANGQILSQQNEEVKQLTSKAAVLENSLNQAQKNRNALAIELANQKDNNRRLKEAAGKQISPGEIVALENTINELQGKLNNSEGERLKDKKKNEQLNQKNSLLQSQLNKLKKEKSDADAEGAFFKNKLFQAQNYITQLEQASNNNEDLTNKLKEIPVLQETLKELKTALQAQKGETEAKIARIDALEKKLQEVQDQADFFRKKLLEAETYINHLEQTIPEQEDIDTLKQRLSQAEAAVKAWETKARSAQEKNKELSLMNEELLNHLNDRRSSQEIRRLQDSLIELRTALNESQATNKTLQSRLADSPSPPQKQPSKEDFFKEKLLQAESYIRQLQDENRKLGDRVEEAAIAPQEEYEELGRLLEETEGKNGVLANEVERLEQENQQQRELNAQLQQTVADLKEDNVKLQQELTKNKEDKDAKWNEMQVLLQDKEKELNDTKKNLEESEAKKNEAEERAKKFEDLSNTLQETLTIFDNIPRGTEPSEQLQQQLTEAEGRINQLTSQTQQKDKVISHLKDQISQLQRQKQDDEVHRKQQKDSQQQQEVDQESTIFALEDERNALQEQLNQLQNANKDLQGELSTLKDQLAFHKQLLHDLQQQSEKAPEYPSEQEAVRQVEPSHEEGLAESIPIDQNGQPLPAQPKVNQTLAIRPQPASRSSPQQQANNFALDFLKQKLHQAQELILQQQNEINKLTDELVRHQNDSTTLKRQLSTHKREEEDMEEAIRALSSSQQDLVERVEPLENANESLRDQVRQAKQTIAELKDYNAAKERQVDALREKNVSLEKEKARLSIEVRQPLQEKEGAKLPLEVEQENLPLEEEKPLKKALSPQKEQSQQEREEALQGLRAENNRLQENNRQLSAANRQLENINRELVENNSQLSSIVNALQDQKHDQNQINLTLDERWNALSEKNNALQAKKAELQQQKVGLDEANKVLDDENKLLNEKANQLQQTINDFQAKNQDLQQQIANLVNHNTELANQNAEIARNNDELKKENEELTSNNAGLTKQKDDLAKQNADLFQKNLSLEEQLQANPFEEQHEKFIELQATVLQLKDVELNLENALSDAKRQNQEIQQRAEENSAENAKKMQEKQAQIDHMQSKLSEAQSKADKIQSEKEVLQKRLEGQLSESGKLTLEREAALEKEVDDLTEKLVGEVMKARELERDLAAKEQSNDDLQNALNAANQNLQEMQRTIDNLTNAFDRTVTPLQQELSAAKEENQKLKAILKEKEEKIQQLVPQIQSKNALEGENKELKQRLEQKDREVQAKLLDKEQQREELLGKLAEAEDCIAELQQNKSDAEGSLSKVLANVQSLRQQSDNLADNLRTTNAEKQKLLAEIKSLQEQAEMAQSDNQRLNSKVSYLNSILDIKDQEIANLSELSRDRETELQALKQGLPVGNILPDSYKQEKEESHQEGPNSNDLNDQINQLNAELQKKDQENRQLKVQRVNLQGEVAELQELLKNQDTDEDLKQHLVQADRTNIELIRQNQQLAQEVEALARDKAYLECELTQLKNRTEGAPLSPREAQPFERVEAVSVPSAEDDIGALRDQIEQLTAELEQERGKVEELLVLSVQNDSLKHIKDSLEQRLQQGDAERNRLLHKLREAEEALGAALPQQHQQEEIARKDDQLARKEEQLAQAQERISQLQAQSQADRRQQALGQNLKKMLDLSNKQQDIDEQLTQQLQNFPYLHEFINSLLYRLRLASALELEKSLKIKQLTDQLQAAQRQALDARDLRAGNDFLKEEVKRLEEQGRAKEKDQQAKQYEAFEELLHYSGLNKDLQAKLAEISELAEEQDKRIKGYQQQLDTSQPSQVDNDLSQENYELRRKLESSEREIQRLRGDSSLSSKEVFYMQFLKTCLDKVVDLEREVQQVQRTIEQTAMEGSHRSQAGVSQPEDTLQERLQELQDKLVRNAHNIREHQQQSDGQLFDLLRDLAELKELPEASRARIDDYLSQLEAQILQEHDQHNAEVSQLRDQVASLQHSARSNEDSPRGTREELLREITHLNNAIEIYYQESMRRKRNYRKTIEALLADLQHIQNEGDKEKVTAAAEDMGRRLRSALENDEEEDARQMELGDDFIISGNQMQILDNRQKTPLPAIDQHPTEEHEVQTDDDPKPFLAFLLSNPDLEKEDLKLLKRKVAELRGREVQESLQALRGQQRRLEEVLQLGGRENPQQLDNILLTLANTYSRDEISQIFGSQDNDELLNKLNEALCLEESFYRGEHSASLLQHIQDRKNKYYDSPTKLSEEVYNHLVALLSAKKDDEFYDEIEALFRDLFETEVGFEQALKKKDEVYRYHNERMNQIFNRSSSEGSEEYMNVFEGQPPAEEGLEMHSERKPRRSEPEHDSGSER